MNFNDNVTFSRRAIDLDDGTNAQAVVDALMDRLKCKTPDEIARMKPPAIIRKSSIVERTTHYNTDAFEPGPCVKDADVRMFDEVFVSDGISGMDEIKHGEKILRNGQYMDIVSYLSIFFNPEKGREFKWYKVYENGMINGEKVTRHCFRCDDGRSEWDVKFYKGHSRMH